ncbi:MAG: single-stranded DNA-binding protein [Ruminococcaceae bacterium]|nr:single-stranded DNA-binding protein [Oscillospiraceae bacterium]
MINCAVIMGRLTADPELRKTPTGKSVVNFTVAVDRTYVRPGEDRQADFINVVAWNQTADFITRYFRKGSMIAVQGSIQTRSYEDKNGNKRQAVEILADNVSFCGSKASNDQAQQNRFEAPAQNAPAYQSESTDSFNEIGVSENGDTIGFGEQADGEDELPF